MQIAIDGPASSGKSTIAKIIAKQLNLVYIDTGAMYRSITYHIIKNNIGTDDEQRIKEILNNLEISFQEHWEGQRVYINGHDITSQIRSKEVNQHVSEISALRCVREYLVRQQQQIAYNHSVIMDGRDIGTIVLKNADYKFYLVASSRIRAERRVAENIEKGFSKQSIDEVEQSIIDRDHYDMNREISPLTKADDAIEIDTTYLTIQEVVNKLLDIIKK